MRLILVYDGYASVLPYDVYNVCTVRPGVQGLHGDATKTGRAWQGLR